MLWILLSIAIVYARSLPIYFSGDDWAFLYGALSGFDLSYIFRFSPGSFAPLINLAFLIFYKIFYLNQVYYHIVALSIHASNCILLFHVIQEISENKKLAFLTAFLFSLFSPYNQIVIWISGLAGLITSLFFLSSLWSFIRYAKSGRNNYFLLCLATFICALFCKEWAIILPGLFLAYHIFYFKSLKDRIKLFKIYIPLLVISILYLTGELSLPYSDKREMFGTHIFSNLSTYLTTFIIPSQNISEFPLKALIPFLTKSIPLIVRGLSILVPLLSGIAIISGANFIRFYALWLYITLFPFLFFTWGTASRYYYVPSMGFVAILTYLFLKVTTASPPAKSSALIRRVGILCLSIFVVSHIFLIQVRITKLYHQNKNIQHILGELQTLQPEFPPYSRLYFSGFSYDRKWGYAVRTIYRDSTLTVLRRLPSPEDLKDTSSPIFIFVYRDGHVTEQ